MVLEYLIVKLGFQMQTMSEKCYEIEPLCSPNVEAWHELHESNF
jgi:hypothetical protein